MSALLRALVALALLAVFAPAAQALEFSPWSTAVNAESVLGTSELLNTDVQDGCPIQSPDRLSLYMASTRPGGQGGIDIWVAQRDSQDAPWGAPENLPAPINSASDDFCPTPIRGGGLFFVSRRVTPGVTCGMGDIYLTRLNPGTGWETPQHLGCEAGGDRRADALLLERARHLQERAARRRELRPSGGGYLAKQRIDGHPAERAP
jgi:hypothetical protein